jgi:tetratricopeptide (TPR) repeat protein
MEGRRERGGPPRPFTMHRFPSSPRLALAALVAAFVATLGVLLLTRDEPREVAAAGPQPGAPVSRPAGEVTFGDTARAATTTGARIRALSAAVRERPKDTMAAAALAGAYLQRARENADPTNYLKASEVLERALQARPGDPTALSVRGGLRLARHDFAGALADARSVLARGGGNPPYGVLVDALAELGRYDEATDTVQIMLDRKPNIESYARAAYVRELRGDLAGAAEAMRLAVAAGGAVPENEAYVASLLGDLEFTRGRLGAAATAYRDSERRFAGFSRAEMGLARVDAARGRTRRALERLRRLVARLPAAPALVELGELELAAGQKARAKRHLALAAEQNRLELAAGVKPDAIFITQEIDHGDARRALRLARAAYAAAPSVRSADAVGWALTRTGQPEAGLRWARRALRLGSRDPLFLFHAGMAAHAAGDNRSARRWLGRLLDQTPRFSPWRSPQARAAHADARSRS